MTLGYVFFWGVSCIIVLIRGCPSDFSFWTPSSGDPGGPILCFCFEELSCDPVVAIEKRQSGSLQFCGLEVAFSQASGTPFDPDLPVSRVTMACQSL